MYAKKLDRIFGQSQSDRNCVESHESYVHRSLMSISQCFREEMKTLNKHYKIDEQKKHIHHFFRQRKLTSNINYAFLFGSVPLGRHWHNAIKVQKWKTVLIFTGASNSNNGALDSAQFLNCTYYSSRYESHRNRLEMAVNSRSWDKKFLAVCLSTTVMISSLLNHSPNAFRKCVQDLYITFTLNFVISIKKLRQKSIDCFGQKQIPALISKTCSTHVQVCETTRVCVWYGL